MYWAPAPLIFWLGELSCIRFSLKFGSVTLDPIGLLGKTWKQEVGLHPTITCFT
jgi:hypothetical protein